MYRASLRSSAQFARAMRRPAVSAGARRLASTAAGSSSGTWKGSVARWGLAVGALYWYNTSPIFADAQHDTTAPASATVSDAAAAIVPQESEFTTVDALLEEKQKAAAAAKAAAKKTDAPAPSSAPPPPGGEGVAVAGDGSPEALEEEASQQGAFNPETGEINWDCPCLGGMAHGPCGEDFKAAFSCFVYSTEEPKGMDCIEKFQHMQDCFRQYPEIYGAELADEDDAEGNGAESQQPAPVEGVPESAAAPASQPASVKPAAEPTENAKTTATAEKTPEAPAKAKNPKTSKAKAAKAPKEDVVQSEKSLFHTSTEETPAEGADDRHVPRAAFDATGANKN